MLEMVYNLFLLNHSKQKLHFSFPYSFHLELMIQFLCDVFLTDSFFSKHPNKRKISKDMALQDQNGGQKVGVDHKLKLNGKRPGVNELLQVYNGKGPLNNEQPGNSKLFDDAQKVH